MAYSQAAAETRIMAALAAMTEVQITQYDGDLDLRNLAFRQGVLVEAVHCYVDVTNAGEMLWSDTTESERTHKRYLRFLHIYQRIADHVLQQCGSVKIDFQNQRLHFVVADPRGDAPQRVRLAIAVARAVRMAIRKGNQLHPELPDAKVAVGIESGWALAVQNGTRGDREPLFLGNPANLAAKLAAKAKPEVVLGPVAAGELGKSTTTEGCVLTTQEVNQIAYASGMWIDAEALVDQWRSELQRVAQADFQFRELRAPLKDLTLSDLTPANSRRSECASLFADVDGFTKYVAEAVQTRSGLEQAVRVMHAIRKEMRDVLHDFGGRKIRYVGDCIHGLLLADESGGQARATVAMAVRAAEALRFGFKLIVETEGLQRRLGLQIGIDYGPLSVTGIGIRGRRSRVTVGRAVIESERIQQTCSGIETKLGTNAAWIAAGSEITMPVAPHRAPMPPRARNAINVPLRGYHRRSRSPYLAGDPLQKQTGVDFEMELPPDLAGEVRWQVVNTGYEAIADKGTRGLRGSIEAPRNPGKGATRQPEATAYRGIHSIKGIVVAGGMCVAESPEFIVRVV